MSNVDKAYKLYSGKHTTYYDASFNTDAIFECVSKHMSKTDKESYSQYHRHYEAAEPVVIPQLKSNLKPTNCSYLFAYGNKVNEVISENSSSRKVHRYLWKTEKMQTPLPVAVKFVSNKNNRDGRSLKREIECHLYTKMKLDYLYELDKKVWNFHSGLYSFARMQQWAPPINRLDAWCSSELIGYHNDKEKPGNSILVTRKLSGPDFFDIIRCEHTHAYSHHSLSYNRKVKCNYVSKNQTKSLNARIKNRLKHKVNQDYSYLKYVGNTNANIYNCYYYPMYYDYYKLRWAAIMCKRLSQFHSINVRHNDIKPDNIVCDFFNTSDGKKNIDVKIIDLGTASLSQTKEFTGGTSWYESPEQKLLEYFGKMKHDYDTCERININLLSDLWGAGLTLTEMLLGRRVFDAVKNIQEMNALEYIGHDIFNRRVIHDSFYSQVYYHGINSSYYDIGGDSNEFTHWRIHPDDWIKTAKTALFQTSNLTNSSPILRVAAEWLYDNLVKTTPSERKNAFFAMDKLEKFAEEHYNHIRYELTSFNGNINGFDLPKFYYNSY